MNKKRHLLLILFVFATCAGVQAQRRSHSTYYEQRASLFEVLPTSPDDIIFLGNSITDGCEWAELFDNKNVKNRGISGDICDGIIDRIETITKGQPAKIFLMIGTNDMAHGISADTISYKVREIIRTIKKESPATQIYLQSILPTNDCYGKFTGHTQRWEMIPDINRLLKEVAKDEDVEYIDLFSLFADSEAKMDTAYSNDGLHLNGRGYQVWRDALKDKVGAEK